MALGCAKMYVFPVKSSHWASGNLLKSSGLAPVTACKNHRFLPETTGESNGKPQLPEPTKLDPPDRLARLDRLGRLPMQCRGNRKRGLRNAQSRGPFTQYRS